ncbi:putative 3',5'-bisphosphate nucleotidase [Triangularia setosa]|uniref:3',5'-bisphosphate nucleotidase n=1 Tax=Triangularia setosa TaxID=2587417 RepID=A0AAN6WFS8_9PEZI|nr:putative 3',5'-bisphosphate nucleotidase [Podospora setosa]
MYRPNSATVALMCRANIPLAPESRHTLTHDTNKLTERMDSPLHHELTLALGLARQAALVSRTVLSEFFLTQQKSQVDSVTKSDFSPVTVADFAIQALLAGTLSQEFPNDALVGEESADELRENPQLLQQVAAVLKVAQGGWEARDENHVCDVIDLCKGEEKKRRTWVFDPIDGTKTFLKGKQYAINIALLEEGEGEGSREEVMSVVACPLLDWTLGTPGEIGEVINDASVDKSGKGAVVYCVKGHGVFVEPLFNKTADDKPRRIPRHAEQVKTVGGLKSVTCWQSLDSGVDTVHERVAEKLGMGFPGSDLLGWVNRWVCLALGLANTTVWVYKKRERKAKIWDHAGAMLLFREAGGKITDVDGKEIDLSEGRLLDKNFGFLAAPEGIHGVVLEAVQEAMRERGEEQKAAGGLN